MIHRRGERLNDDDEDSAQLITDLETGTGGAGHKNTKRKTQSQRDGEGGETEAEGDGDLLCDNLVDGYADSVFVGYAQIAMEELGVETAQLLVQGVVQAQRIQFDLDLHLGHLVEVFEITLDGHEPQQGEENGDDDEHGEQGTEFVYQDSVYRHGLCA